MGLWKSDYKDLIDSGAKKIADGIRDGARTLGEAYVEGQKIKRGEGDPKQWTPGDRA